MSSSVKQLVELNEVDITSGSVEKHGTKCYLKVPFDGKNHLVLIHNFNDIANLMKWRTVRTINRFLVKTTILKQSYKHSNKMCYRIYYFSTTHFRYEPLLIDNKKVYLVIQNGCPVEILFA